MTVTGTPDATNTPTQSALQFDGVDDYVDIGPMSENISGAYTFEAWVYYNPDAFTDNNWMRIVELGNGPDSDNLLLAIDPGSGLFSFDTRNDDIASNVKSDTTAPTGQWIHVAGVNDGDPDGNDLATGYLYINGELVKTESENQQIAQDVVRLNNYIGQSNWDGESPMHGAAADVRIWNDARTSDEIKANYNTTLTGHEDNLLAYYTFEDIENGVVRDVTNNGNDAQVVAASSDPAIAEHGPTGDVLQLDGNGDYVRVAHDAALNPTTWTLEAWFKTTSHSGTDSTDFGRIAAKGVNSVTNGLSLGVIGGKLRGDTNGVGDANTVESTATVNDGKWHHGAWVYDGTSIKLYVDGILDQDQDIVDPENSIPVLTAENDLLIGAYDDGTNPLIQFFNGSIDNVRLWDDARTDTEIRDGMTRSYDYDTDNLIAQYTFDDIEDGDTVLDGAHTTTAGIRADNYDGALNGDASIVDSGAGGGLAISHLDKAIRFDGTGDSASDPDGDAIGPLGDDERTIMLWARTDSEEPQTFISYGNGAAQSNFRFGLNGWDDPGGSLEGGKGVTVDIGTGAITFQPLTATDDGQWHHYAVVLPADGDSPRDLRVYQDGVLLTTISALHDDDDTAINTVADGSNPGPLNLGHFGGQTYFNGDMAEISLWSTDLSTAQIKQYMNDQLSGGESGLSAYWRGSDNGSGAVKDYAGNNDLTLNNDASVVDVAPDVTTNSIRIGEDTIATGQVTTSDINSSATYSVQTAAGNGTITIDSATGVWNYTPNAGFSGTDTFTLRATGDVETEDEVISVRVGQDPVLPGNYSVSLDGTDDYIDFGRDIADGGSDGQQSFSVEMWVYVHSLDNGSGGASTNTDKVILSKGNDNALNDAGWSVRTGTGYIEVRTSDGEGGNEGDGNTAIQNTLGNTVSEGWHHLAFVVNRDTDTLEAYLDGSADPFNPHSTIGASLTNVGSISNTDSMMAGNTDGADSQHYNGSITDIRVWDDVRTSDEIQNAYDRQLNGDEDGLAGYWTFEEGTGNVTQDQSGNGNDASIIGGTHENMTEISMAAGATYKGLILGSDADENDNLSYSVSSDAAGTLSLDSDGSFEYTNDTDADDSFEVTITDDNGNQTIETINIDVP